MQELSNGKVSSEGRHQGPPNSAARKAFDGNSTDALSTIVRMGAKKLRHKREFVQSSRRSRPAVESMHLTFPLTRPEFPGDISNQGSSRSSRIFHLFAALHKIPHPIAHLRVISGFGPEILNKLFGDFLGFLMLVSQYLDIESVFNLS
jgi:hypothetical protein